MMEILLQFTPEYRAHPMQFPRESPSDYWQRKRAAYQRRRVFSKRTRPPGPSWWAELGKNRSASPGLPV